MKDLSHSVTRYADRFYKENEKVLSKNGIDKKFIKEFIKDHNIHVQENSNELSMHSDMKAYRDGKRVSVGTMISWLISHKELLGIGHD